MIHSKSNIFQIQPILQYADPDHIYHTLDSNSGGNGGEHPLESVGVIDVKLPNGRTVAATLVREAAQLGINSSLTI